MRKYLTTSILFIPCQAMASGQTGTSMLIIYIILIVIVFAIFSLFKCIFNVIRNRRRSGHKYAFLKAEEKLIEVDITKINKSFFNKWAERMEYPKYKIISNGNVVDLNSPLRPNEKQVFEIIRENV